VLLAAALAIVLITQREVRYTEAAPIVTAEWITVGTGVGLKVAAEADMRDRLATLELESLSTPQAVFVLFRCLPVKKKLLSRVEIPR